jgi:uncharacterized membrane protein YdbT with pleckstrin-like domain
MPQTLEQPKRFTSPRAARSAPGTVQRAEGLGPGADQAVARRAAAMLPGELLQPSEIIILLLKPSPLFIILAPLRTLVTLAVLTLGVLAANAQFALGWPRRDILLIGIGVIGLRLFWQFLEWLSRVYVLTDQRVIRVRGVLRVSVFETRLEQIQHTDTQFSVRERLFALGTVTFATAGTGVIEAAWTMIAKPLEVHRTVVRTIRRYRRF